MITLDDLRMKCLAVNLMTGFFPVREEFGPEYSARIQEIGECLHKELGIEKDSPELLHLPMSTVLGEESSKKYVEFVDWLCEEGWVFE